MRYASGTAGRRRGPRGPAPWQAAGCHRHAGGRPAAWALAVAAAAGIVLALGACTGMGSGGDGAVEGEERTVLLTRKNESRIQVTESERDGNQIVRIRTVFRGEENVITLDIDQPVYEVEIPLSLEDVMPQAASPQVRGPEGQFQDLLIAQWLQKAQEAMLAGDYNTALKHVDTVLQVQPNHVQAHAMKGSVYYALGNYQLADEEWEYVLSLDPSNKEVLDMQEFLRNRGSGQPPRLPGAPEGTTPQQQGQGEGQSQRREQGGVELQRQGGTRPRQPNQGTQ